MANRHIYESLNREELQAIIDKEKPDFWTINTRPDPVTLDTIYVLEWYRW